MANEKVVESFNKSVKELTLAIDLRIESKDYTGARGMVDEMETILKIIVYSMVLHNHLDRCESEMVMMFVHRIAADKRKIICINERLRRFEFKEDYESFKQVKNRWEEYITTPPYDESKNSHQINHRSESDDDTDDL